MKSKTIGYWSQRKTRGANNYLRKCPHCGEMRGARHISACQGKPEEEKHPHPQGHTLCACGRRWIRADADRCFLCSGWDKEDWPGDWDKRLESRHAMENR